MTAQVTATRRALSTLPFFGIPVHEIPSYEEAGQWIGEQIRARRKTFCVSMNPEKLERAAHDRTLRLALERAHLALCDGVGISLASRLLHGRQIPRCTGVDLFLTLISMAEREGWRVFFLGASPESNCRAVEKARELHPRLAVAGRLDGFFADTAAAVAHINGSRADVLFVAMGTPRQEYWIAENLDRIAAPFCMGVGGSFDILSGMARRAPRVFRSTGTEWLYRLACNPSRWKRQIALPRFAVSVVQEHWRLQQTRPRLLGNPRS